MVECTCSAKHGSKALQRAIDRADNKSAQFLQDLQVDLEPTAIDIKHIEHSDECVEAVSASFFNAVLPRFCNRLCVETLGGGQGISMLSSVGHRLTYNY